MNQIENTILLLTGFTGFILIYVMLTTFRSNLLVNGFLIFNFVLASSRFSLIGTYNLHIQDYVADIQSPYKIILLLIFPSSYLYFKSIISDQRKRYISHVKHLIAPLLMFVFNVLAFHAHLEKNLVTIVNFAFSTIFAVFYLSITFRILYRELWTKRMVISSGHYLLMRNWSIFYFSICIFLTFRLIFSFIYEILYAGGISGNQLSFTFAAIVWLLVFLKILITPEILFGLPKLQVKTHHFNNSPVNLTDSWIITPDAINSDKDLKLKKKLDHKIMELIQEVEVVGQEKMIFKNPKVTISDLALEVGVPESHLTYLFRYHSRISFSEYKNRLRIQYSISLINEDYLLNNTLESLAEEVGFASYSPFFNTFKKLKGVGPNEFTNKVALK